MRAEFCQLGQVVDDNVGIIRMVLYVVLVIILRCVEFLERNHLGDDFLGEDFCSRELRNIGLSNLFLLLTGNRRVRSDTGCPSRGLVC